MINHNVSKVIKILFLLILTFSFFFSCSLSPQLTDEGKAQWKKFEKKFGCGEIDFGDGKTSDTCNNVRNYFWVSIVNCSYFKSDSIDNYIDTFSSIAKTLYNESNRKGNCDLIKVEYLYDFGGHYFDYYYFDIITDALIFH